jgi:uncharacterized phiE125 gp8 family phage protein
VPQITLAEAKLFCRVEHFDDDALIDQLILSATKHVERVTGWALNPQTQQKSHKRVSEIIRLPHWPVNAVTDIERVGTTTVSVASNFDVDLTERPARVTPIDGMTLASGEVIRISYTVGSNDPPDDLRQAVLMLVAHWYENREAAVSGSTTSEVDMGVTRLCAGFIGLRLS